MGRCITCNASKHYKEAQAGHFASRSNNILRYNEENVNLQCVGCNMFKSGEQYAYSLALDLKYGDGTARKLHDKSKEKHQWKPAELEAIIDYYQRQIDTIQKLDN